MNKGFNVSNDRVIFSYADLCNPSPKGVNHLKGIEEKILFLFSMVYTVLIDQAVYTYERENYDRFKQLTVYPKMTGFLSSGMNYVNPYAALISDVLVSHGLREEEAIVAWRDYTVFIAEDLPTFFREHGEAIGIKYDTLLKKILNDKDFVKEPYGSILAQSLIS